MKIFTKKHTLQKTIIAVLMVLCINFIIPTYSHAGIGGILMTPVIDFFTAIGDIVESLMQWSMTGQMAAGESLLDSNVLVDQDDSRVDHTSEDATMSVSKDDLYLGWFTFNADKYQVPIIEYTPEEIFSNKVPYLDINFITPKWTSRTSEYGINGTAAILQETIAQWYVALRNLSIVGLLCVLVYVGIRIMLSSTAGDKAKFKQMFTDWLIALCILFFLHYIMSFTLVLVDSVNDALVGGNDTYQAKSVVIDVEGERYATNFMGAARFMVQSKDVAQRVGYMMVYLALVAYTAVFTWHYLKRLLMMAFLTIIAPLVALTYPIDKIGDGKAQAFSMWLKEYVYNALIQPFHLIIYMIFVGTAMDLAKVNLLYALAAIGFILPAEKFLKKMFGFDRAPLGTMGALTGFTAGSLMSKLGGKGSSGGSKGGKTDSKPSDENKPPRYERHHGTDGIDYRDNSNLDRPGPQGENNLYEGQNDSYAEKTRDSQADRMADTRGLPSFDDAIDVDYKEKPLNDNEKFETNGEESKQDETYDAKQENNKFQRLSDDDVDVIEPEKIRTMDDLDIDNKTKDTQQPKSDDNTRRSKQTFKQGMRNIVSAHGGGKHIALKGAKTLGKAAKFTAKAAFTATGAVAGAAVGLASGKGIAGVMAGAAAGKSIGNRVGRFAADLPENAYNKVGKGVTETLRSTIDTYNGDTIQADKARERAFMKDEATEKYIRDKWTKEHNGQAPSREEIKKELEDMKPYVSEGMTDASAIYRARKAEKFGVSAKQSAKIAALAKDRKITSDVLGDEKKFNQRKADFTQEFIDKGFNNEEAAKQADYVLNVMKAQVGQQHNLKKSSTENANSRATRTNTRASANNAGTRTNTRKNTNTSRTRKKPGSTEN